MAKSKSDPIPANFEDALSQLDMIVEDLEGEAVPLADLVCAAIGWRVKKANIVCVILQGSLQSLCEALGSSVNVCGACPVSLWAHVVIMLM